MVGNKQYLSNFMCAYYQGQLTSYSNKACTLNLTIKGTNPYIYDIQFKGIKWVGNSNENVFTLSFSDPVNYNQLDNTST